MKIITMPGPNEPLRLGGMVYCINRREECYGAFRALEKKRLRMLRVEEINGLIMHNEVLKTHLRNKVFHAIDSSCKTVGALITKNNGIYTLHILPNQEADVLVGVPEHFDPWKQTKGRLLQMVRPEDGKPYGLRITGIPIREDE